MSGAARSGWAALLVGALSACAADGSGDLEAPAGEGTQPPVAAPLGRAADEGEGADGGVCGCKTEPCGAGTICKERPRERDDGGFVSECPEFDCLPSPPYCNLDLECETGECTAVGRCACVDSPQCNDIARFICQKEEGDSRGVCANKPCQSRAECCDDAGADCAFCSAGGVCVRGEDPFFAPSGDPSLACGVQGGVQGRGLAPGSAAACALGLGAAAGALAAGALRRRRRQKKVEATEICGAHSRKGP